MDVSSGQIQQINDKLDSIADRLARLETLSETEADRCRYLPDIVTARHTIMDLAETNRKVAENCEAIRLLQMNWAKLVGLMVGAGVLGGTLSNVLAGMIP